MSKITKDDLLTGVIFKVKGDTMNGYYLKRNDTGRACVWQIEPEVYGGSTRLHARVVSVTRMGLHARGIVLGKQAGKVFIPFTDMTEFTD